MKYVVLYYPYTFEYNENVGSNVRPSNILREFKSYCSKKEYELIFIQGEQNERKKQYKLLKDIEAKDILFTYIEFPNIPLLLSDKNHIPSSPFIDYLYFRFFSKNNIPVGGFYRDIYWKFDDMYPLKGLKKVFMKYLNKKNLEFIKKHMDVVFLPSDSMNKHVEVDKKKHLALPSGGLKQLVKDEIEVRTTPIKTFKSIYVGSLHNTANIDSLLKAFRQLNANQIVCKLNLICRKNEYDKNLELFNKNDQNWLRIEHLSSPELRKNFMDADFSIIPYAKNEYNDFAMPVKLFEYMSYGLPILSTDTNEVEKFISKAGNGVITNDSIKGLVSGLNEIMFKINDGQLSKEENYETFIYNHTWEKRIEEIEETLRAKKVFNKN